MEYLTMLVIVSDRVLDSTPFIEAAQPYKVYGNSVQRDSSRVFTKITLSALADSLVDAVKNNT